jgi:hypothetical protein
LIPHRVGAGAHGFSFRRDDLGLRLRHVRLGRADGSRQLIHPTLRSKGGGVSLRHTAARCLDSRGRLLNSRTGSHTG